MLESPDHFTPTQQAVLYVTQYPCLHCVLPKLSTVDQLSYFFNWRLAQTYIALCWSARLAGYDDPLYPELKQKVISKDFYEWVHLKVSYFEALWVLCQFLAPRIAEGVRELGRKNEDRITALLLFRGAVMENANWQVELSCDYVEVSGRNVDTALKLRAKAIKEGLTQKEVLRLQRVTQNSPSSNCLSLLVLTAQKINNKAITAQFEIFMLAMANLCEKEATMARKEGSWGWNNGVKLTGSKSSVYCPVHS
jgi:hypothetical protein